MKKALKIAAVLGAAALLSGCALLELVNQPPGTFPTPKPGEPPIGAPGIVCEPGDTCGCWHRPPGQDWQQLPECGPSTTPGGDIMKGVLWVTMDPKPAPKFEARVRTWVENASGCKAIDGRCPLRMPIQEFLALVIADGRRAGYCVGQHEPGHSDAVMVSDCSNLSVNEEWHVYACGVTCQQGTAAFGKEAYRNTWKAVSQPTPEPEPPNLIGCAPAVTGFRGVAVQTHVGNRYNIQTTPESNDREWCAKGFGDRVRCPLGPGEGAERRACEDALVGNITLEPVAGEIERAGYNEAAPMMGIVHVKAGSVGPYGVKICAAKAPSVCVIATFQ